MAALSVISRLEDGGLGAVDAFSRDTRDETSEITIPFTALPYIVHTDYRTVMKHYVGLHDVTDSCVIPRQRPAAHRADNDKSDSVRLSLLVVHILLVVLDLVLLAERDLVLLEQGLAQPIDLVDHKHFRGRLLAQSQARAVARALLLELDDSYHAALTQAAHMIEGRADELAGELQSAQQQTVNTLLLQPKMLGELGDMRRKLQVAASETEHLRGGLRKMAEREEEQQLLRQVTTQMLPLESGKAALDRRFNPPKAVAAVEAPPAAESQEVVRARELHRRQQQRLLDAVRLKLRLTVHQWRQSKAAYAKQVELMRQLSAQREEEREAAALQSEVLRRLQLEQHELLIEQETWRNQSAEQADVLAAAIATAANGTIQHEDEVVLLSEKLRQVLEEKAGLEALVDSQSADLKIMSSEMIRMMAS